MARSSVLARRWHAAERGWHRCPPAAHVRWRILPAPRNHDMSNMMNPNPITKIAIEIAAQLGETEHIPCATSWRTVRTIGPERAH